eukprot:GHVU01033189.1.p1 GENE.GHVU01033189.1~~GHVU01033189.1.p1  ORF type:complete len:132 (+),score=11.71 GHVU01033189.1:316-711(+)
MFTHSDNDEWVDRQTDGRMDGGRQAGRQAGGWMEAGRQAGRWNGILVCRLADPIGLRGGFSPFSISYYEATCSDMNKLTIATTITNNHINYINYKCCEYHSSSSHGRRAVHLSPPPPAHPSAVNSVGRRTE